MINGHKRFITSAAFHIFIARTSGEPGRAGVATMFLVPSDTPGVELVRHLNTQYRSMLGGHCEIRYKDVWVSNDAVLGDVGEGFDYAQVRARAGADDPRDALDRRRAAGA